MDPITRKLVETVRQITEQRVPPPSTERTVNPPPEQPEQPGIPYHDPTDVWNTHQNNLLRTITNTGPNPVPLAEPQTKYYNPSLDDITGLGKIKKSIRNTLNSLQPSEIPTPRFEPMNPFSYKIPGPPPQAQPIPPLSLKPGERITTPAPQPRVPTPKIGNDLTDSGKQQAAKAGYTPEKLAQLAKQKQQRDASSGLKIYF